MSNTVLVVIQGILAFVFLMAGIMKILQTRQKVIASGGKWAEDFSESAIKIIGVVEVALAAGIIVPTLLNRPAAYTIASGIGISLVMAGAFFTHLRRKEYPFLAVTGLFLALGAVVAHYRQLGI